MGRRLVRTWSPASYWHVIEQLQIRFAYLVQASVADLERRQTELRAELGTELLAQLSAGERAELASLGAALEHLQVRGPGFYADGGPICQHGQEGR